MSYLLSQLWLCLFISTLLGIFIGWLLRGDNKDKLDIIESRWRMRFSELEYSNQELIKKHNVSNDFMNKHSKTQTRLNKMNKAAEMASKQLKTNNKTISSLKEKLERSNNELLNKESHIRQLINQLGNTQTFQKDDQPKE